MLLLALLEHLVDGGCVRKAADRGFVVYSSRTKPLRRHMRQVIESK